MMTSITDILFLAGRILFGGFFLMNAYNHLTQVKMMAGYAGSKGVPFPGLAVVATGLLLGLGGLSVLLGLWPGVGVAALALFLVGTTPLMHAYWKESDPMVKMGEQVNFLKNVALLGGALFLLAVPEPWSYALSL